MERPEQVWLLRIYKQRFEQLVLIRGTEREMRKYIEHEFIGRVVQFRLCTQRELDAAEVLCIPIYDASKL